jgi:epsilon-lactone hydrolase
MASLRAEIVRLGSRWFLKRRNRGDLTVTEGREWLRRIERLTPKPPADAVIRALDLGGVAAEQVTMPISRPDRTILYLHGGGFVTGSPRLFRHLTWRLAAAARARLLAIDYRLAPEHPFPAALDDVFAAYRWFLDEGVEPRRLALVGDSAGGGLALSLLLRLRDDGIALPAAAAVMSPWTDLALTGQSLRANSAADPMLDAAMLPRLVGAYLAGADPLDPYASPLYGDPAGLPPILLQAGGDEILRDDTTRLAERLRLAGCEAVLEIWPRMPHDWHVFASLMPEARRAIARIGRFLDVRL